jgi:Na+-driven multidrug efflux pump
MVFCIMILSDIIPWSFTNDYTVKEYASKLLLSISIMHIFDAFQITWHGLVQAVGGQMTGRCMF